MQESPGPHDSVSLVPAPNDSSQLRTVAASTNGGKFNLRRFLWQGILATAGALWIISSGYVLFGEIWRSRRVPLPPLSIEAASLDFGSVWNSEKFEWTVPIRNASDVPINVGRLEGSCTCTLVTPSSFVLNPGEEVRVKLRYDLFSRTRQNGDATVPFDDLLSAYMNGDERPLAAWHIRGFVKNAFSSKPNQLDFGDAVAEGRPYPTRTINVTCFQSCRDLEVSADEKNVAVVAKNPSGDGVHFQVAVAPGATLASGTHKFKLSLGAVLPSGERTPRVSCPVEVRILPDLQILPSLAHFGELKVGQSHEETIVLASRSGRSFEVPKFDSASKNLEIVPVASDEAGAKVFRVRLTSSKLGSENTEAHFNIRYRDDGKPAARRFAETAIFNVRCFGVR
jgi:Protein of unknown function (DUF1573)